MFSLSAVRIGKAKELCGEAMRAGASADSNLRFDFDSPWPSLSWRGGLSVFSYPNPLLFDGMH